MKHEKKFIVYYNEEKGIIGYRPHAFDWQEGEDIYTNGVKTTIFAIFDYSERNMRIAETMMKTLHRYNPHYGNRIVLNDSISESDINQAGDDLDKMMFLFENSHIERVQTNKKVWKNFDAKLDYVEDMVNSMD